MHDDPNTSRHRRRRGEPPSARHDRQPTVAPSRVTLDPVTRRNVRTAARVELIHVQVPRLPGGRADGGPSKRIWVRTRGLREPRENLLTTLVVGDQIFINAYLLGPHRVLRGGGLRGSRFARYLAEFMGVEAVHRALALQSLGRLGNDRAFMRFGPARGRPGPADDAAPASTRSPKPSRARGRGLRLRQGRARRPGAFYEFDEVSARTPDDPDVNTRTPN
jgi:hypothetical protein